MPSPMPTFHPTDPSVTGLDPALLDAQRQVNAMLAQLPEPDVRTPEGLEAHRAQVVPAPGSTDLTPRDVVIEGPAADLRLRIRVPEERRPRVLLHHEASGPWRLASKGRWRESHDTQQRSRDF